MNFGPAGMLPDGLSKTVGAERFNFRERNVKWWVGGSPDAAPAISQPATKVLRRRRTRNQVSGMCTPGTKVAVSRRMQVRGMREEIDALAALAASSGS